MDKSIEQTSLEIVTKVAKEWTSILKTHACHIGEIELRSSGNEDNYFSEIEAYIWQGSNVAAVLSLILYLKGKQTMTYKELEVEANSQLQEIVTKVST